MICRFENSSLIIERSTCKYLCGRYKKGRGRGKGEGEKCKSGNKGRKQFPQHCTSLFTMFVYIRVPHPKKIIHKCSANQVANVCKQKGIIIILKHICARKKKQKHDFLAIFYQIRSQRRNWLIRQPSVWFDGLWLSRFKPHGKPIEIIIYSSDKLKYLLWLKETRSHL